MTFKKEFGVQVETFTDKNFIIPVILLDISLILTLISSNLASDLIDSLIKVIFINLVLVVFYLFLWIFFKYAVKYFVKLIKFLKSINQKTTNSEKYIVSGRMRRGDELERSFEYGRLKWIAYIPNQTLLSLNAKDEYVWLKGPFCPDCTLELNWKKNIIKPKWYCERCNKNFDPLKRTAEECRDFVEKICYADFFRKRKFERAGDTGPTA